MLSTLIRNSGVVRNSAVRKLPTSNTYTPIYSNPITTFPGNHDSNTTLNLQRHHDINIRNYSATNTARDRHPYTIIASSKRHGKLRIVPLLPENQKDFESFKKIITNEGVVFTSSWIDTMFNLKTLKEYCNNFKTIQEGLDDFFSQEKNYEKLQDNFYNLTQYNVSHHAGYCAVLDKNNNLIGGLGLVPTKIISTELNDEVKRLDIAFHILPEHQKGGIGTILVERMLRYVFDELESDLIDFKPSVKEVVGSSIHTQIGTYTLCSKFGMVIREKELANGEIYKYYYIDSDMWEAIKAKIKPAERLTSVDKAMEDAFSKTIKNVDKNNTSNAEKITAEREKPKDTSPSLGK